MAWASARDPALWPTSHNLCQSCLVPGPDTVYIRLLGPTDLPSQTLTPHSMNSAGQLKKPLSLFSVQIKKSPLTVVPLASFSRLRLKFLTSRSRSNKYAFVPSPVEHIFIILLAQTGIRHPVNSRSKYLEIRDEARARKEGPKISDSRSTQ